MQQPTSPFPFSMPKTGALVTDERCKCGGLRSEHKHTLAYGHGPRIVGDVALCERFTWVGWVFTTMALHPRYVALDDRHTIKLERASVRQVGAKGWRYEVRDLATYRTPGEKLFTCAAPGARTKADAIAHARIELQRFVERRQPTLGGVS